MSAKTSAPSPRENRSLYCARRSNWLAFGFWNAPTELAGIQRSVVMPAKLNGSPWIGRLRPEFASVRLASVPVL